MRPAAAFAAGKGVAYVRWPHTPPSFICSAPALSAPRPPYTPTRTTATRLGGLNDAGTDSAVPTPPAPSPTTPFPTATLKPGPRLAFFPKPVPSGTPSVDVPVREAPMDSTPPAPTPTTPFPTATLKPGPRLAFFPKPVPSGTPSVDVPVQEVPAQDVQCSRAAAPSRTPTVADATVAVTAASP
jgi:hypothetical protein